MKITVLITCYAEGNKLLDAVSSLRKQSLQDYELLIVNDHSTDEQTNKVCRDLAQSGINIIWRSHNGGLSAARNTGIAAAKHELIVPLDADDILPEHALETIHLAFESFHCDFIFGNYSFGGKTVYTDSLCAKGNQLEPSLLISNWLLLGTSPFKKQVWADIGGYDEDPIISNTVQDMDFFMSAITAGKKGCHVRELIYQWNDTPESMNKRIPPKAYAHLEIKHLSFLKKYKFHDEAQMNNYIVTMLFHNKQYRELTNFSSPSHFRCLSFKNRIKYLYACILKSQYE